MRVRPATADDVPAIVEVWRAAERGRTGAAPGEADERAVAFYTRTSPLMVVGDDSGRVVSVAAALPARENDGAGPPIPGLCHVAMVFVDPEYWACGVGTRTFDGLLAEVAAAGFDEAQLWVQEHNPPARALFTRYGFAPSGRVREETTERLLLLRAPVTPR